jgi:hypothetical protein
MKSKQGGSIGVRSVVEFHLYLVRSLYLAPLHHEKQKWLPEEPDNFCKDGKASPSLSL